MQGHQPCDGPDFSLKKETLVKFLMDNWMLIAVAIASAVALFLPVMRKGGSGLNAALAVQMINRDKAVVIDVCEPAEYAAGHVAGARNIPLGRLEQQLEAAVKNKATPVILVCQVGARAARAVSIAQKLGYDNAQALSGGLRAWRDAQLPVEKA
jgi:rhodanese-related sulfurtransferase